MGASLGGSGAATVRAGAVVDSGIDKATGLVASGIATTAGSMDGSTEGSASWLLASASVSRPEVVASVTKGVSRGCAKSSSAGVIGPLSLGLVTGKSGLAIGFAPSCGTYLGGIM